MRIHVECTVYFSMDGGSACTFEVDNKLDTVVTSIGSFLKPDIEQKRVGGCARIANKDVLSLYRSVDCPQSFHTISHWGSERRSNL